MKEKLHNDIQWLTTLKYTVNQNFMSRENKGQIYMG